MEMEGISFTSHGMAVLDEIRIPGQMPLTDVLGGSGAYATLGARLFLPPPSSRSVGWLLHIGDDFPEHVLDRLESWETTLVVKKELAHPSTRGLLEYKDTSFGPKDFRYTTALDAVEHESLKEIPILASKASHYLEAPEKMETLISEHLSLRNKAGILGRPLVIWEPAPLSCKFENLESCLYAARIVDVFSPNHLELMKLFGKQPGVFDKGEIEALVSRLLESGVGPDGNGIVLIRAGEHGCLVRARHIDPVWLPPFYRTPPDGTQHEKVIDPTGAGNTFLGAWAVGYLITESAFEAACYGAVGASFALEQVGMPERGDADKEVWNGVDVLSRLREYLESVGLGKQS
ncbi:hypothetical protein BDV12DRAFT_168694 [Aspergillus spectabilis]